LDLSKFGANLNPFEMNLIQFENRIGRTVLPTPPVRSVPTASPHCPTPHPATRRPRCSMPCQGPLSLPLQLHAASSPPPPAPRRFLLKRSRRPPAEIFFSPRTLFVSFVHARAPCIRPHHLGILLTGFPPPKPLLRAGLYPRATTVHPRLR
jgi:hypothetical protein